MKALAFVRRATSTRRPYVFQVVDYARRRAVIAWLEREFGAGGHDDSLWRVGGGSFYVYTDDVAVSVRLQWC